MNLTDNLLKLHRVEGQVRGLRSRLTSAERYLTAQSTQLDDLRQQDAELKSRKRQLQATIANLETEGAAHVERIEKLREELNSASTNKQYTAVLNELNTIKKLRAAVDDRILEQMDAIEQLTAQLEELADRLTERAKVQEVAEAELQERKDDIGDRLAELEVERDAAACDVPGAELAVFNEVAHVHDGEAMAPVEEIDRRNREYACGECNMHMPFEAVALLMGETDALVRCSACTRILYLQEETRGALAKK